MDGLGPVAQVAGTVRLCIWTFYAHAGKTIEYLDTRMVSADNTQDVGHLILFYQGSKAQRLLQKSSFLQTPGNTLGSLELRLGA